MRFGSPFRSFLIGGFEGSSHVGHGRQLDVIAATGHDRLAEVDYGLLQEAGLLTARDALRWHLIEREPGRYDWSSWDPMVDAAERAGVSVIWDLVHYGVPAGLDIWSDAFVERAAAFATAAAVRARERCPAPRMWAPMNEISFWAWAGGDQGYLPPAATGRGRELKRQLARAAIAAARAIREADPGARLLQPEPLIHIIGHPDRPEDHEPAELYRRAQYEAWDMLDGRLQPELGGEPGLLDVVGVNFYFNNQWIHGVETMALGHRLFRPLADMLAEVHERYGRPILISETGAEGRNGPGWLRYVAGEVREALAAGVPVLGICLYPVMDYPGWADNRHCPCGVIECGPDWTGRRLRPDMLRAMDEERERLPEPYAAPPVARGRAAFVPSAMP